MNIIRHIPYLSQGSRPGAVPALGWLFAGLILWLLAGCSSGAPETTQAPETFRPSVASLREDLAATNVLLLDAEKQEILDYIARHGWEMQETGTGLHYMIYHRGKGEKALMGMWATMAYSVHLLSGEKIYSSKELGNKSFLIGQGGVESGLEEGILLLRQGDKARFVMPAHLAHGFPGDGNRIPQRSAIVYDIELISLTNP